ncbi:MAG TPA: ABC transporter ATP-binding protein [Anaeromyxobacteraceae bacterium]|nr:ABC transporter ATP-binding protein [Anaeromyxobacteraceae bacterium]
MIVLKEVQKTYRNDAGLEVRALRGVSLEVRRGDFVAIMGPSGCGKSTLMNVIGTLDRPTAGAYRIGGDEVGALTDEQLSRLRNRRIGFVFQAFHLLPLLTAEENVELPLVYAEEPPPDARARARAALARLGLGDRGHHRPGELSGGQQQRVAIARALVTDPDVIVADEPTGNLDSRASLEVMAVLQELWRQGKTIVLVTHEPDVARYAPRQVSLRDGFVVSDATVAPADAAAELVRMAKEAA